MKTQHLYFNFNLLKKVYDNCSYQRVFELLDAFNEIKEKMAEVENQRQKIAREFSDENKQIPKSKQKDADKQFEELLNTDIKLNKNLKFTQNDLKNSGLKGSEIAVLYGLGFITKK